MNKPYLIPDFDKESPVAASIDFDKESPVVASIDFDKEWPVAASIAGWLWVGVLALGIAGIYSIIVGAARTPKVTSMFPVQDIFKTSLVLHVDMSVLIWFLAFAALVWRLLPLYTQEKPYKAYGWDGLAIVICALGMILMAAAPFLSDAEPLLNNYIPVLNSTPFFMGLGAVLFAILIMALQAVMRFEFCDIFRVLVDEEITRDRAILFGIYSAALITIIAMVCFVLTALSFNVEIEGEQYFEILFWAGGHVIQFTHTQLLMVAWLWLLGGLGLGKNISPATVFVMFGLGVVGVLATPLGYMYEVHSQEHRDFFTTQMIWGSGLAAGWLGLHVMMSLIRDEADDILMRDNKAALTALLMSLLLFYVGGAFGVTIEAETVRTPAHYHGSIVGVTLAFMGVIYLILPKIGYAEVGYRKMAVWQPIIYGFGQLIHISGLAWSGGYGVLRKTPGELEGVFSKAKLAMAIMGTGAGLSVIGGILFVVAIIRSYSARARLS